MSLDQPARDFEPHDTAYCTECDGITEGEWIGDPTRPMSWLCECGFVTPGGEA